MQFLLYILYAILFASSFIFIANLVVVNIGEVLIFIWQYFAQALPTSCLCSSWYSEWRNSTCTFSKSVLTRADVGFLRYLIRNNCLSHLMDPQWTYLFTVCYDEMCERDVAWYVHGAVTVLKYFRDFSMAENVISTYYAVSRWSELILK